MAVLKEQDYDKYARKMKKCLKWELLLHTITDEREIKNKVSANSIMKRATRHYTIQINMR